MKLLEYCRSRFSGYPASLEATLNSFVPHETGIPLIRLGGDEDGAYIVPDDLDGVDGLISLGCGQNINFEQDLFNVTGIHAVIVDSQESFPLNPKTYPHTFLHGWIGNFLQPNNRKLPIHDLSSVLHISRKESLKNGILKVDIESSEYSLLLGTSLDLLKQFRIVIVEFHRLNELKTSSIVRVLFGEIMRKFAEEFVVTHFHPNNAVNYFKVKRTLFPSCVEVTFLRKDRCLFHVPSYREYPTELDITNNVHREIIPIKFPIRIA